MSTVEEIESAIETLPPEQVDAVFQWLWTRKGKPAGEANIPSGKPGGFPLFGVLEGKITYHEGWDEPLEEFKKYTG